MTQHVVHISTNIGKRCEHCTSQVGGEHFAESVNHYLEQHGYEVLHIGTETIPDANGGPWHTTVAVVGK